MILFVNPLDKCFIEEVWNLKPELFYDRCIFRHFTPKGINSLMELMKQD